MKKWTVVVELTVPENLTKADVESAIEDTLVVSDAWGGVSAGQFQIMETIEAPYGPELPGGVYLDVREGPKKVRR